MIVFAQKILKVRGIMPKSGAVAPVRPLTIRELSKMSNAEIADYLNNYQETVIIGMPILAGARPCRYACRVCRIKTTTLYG